MFVLAIILLGSLRCRLQATPLPASNFQEQARKSARQVLVLLVNSATSAIGARRPLDGAPRLRPSRHKCMAADTRKLISFCPDGEAYAQGDAVEQTSESLRGLHCSSLSRRGQCIRRPCTRY